MTSAAFSIEGTTVPAAVSVAYGATVDFVLLSTVGAKSIAWTIAGSSDSSYTNPTITPAGVPSGATASCTQIADPTTGLGASFLVKCVVTDSDKVTYTQYGVFGTANKAGKIPIACGEKLARDATHGWTEELNQAIAAPQVIAAGSFAYDFGSIASDANANTTQTVGAGLLATDRFEVWGTSTAYSWGLVFEAYYNSATQMTVQACNFTAGAIDATSITFYYRVTR